MADTPQQLDQSQLDYIDHPSLGKLAFPKTMGADDRNSIIDGMLQSAPTPNLPGGTERLSQAARGLPATLTQPTKFEKDRAGASPDLFGGSSSTGGGFLHNVRTSLLPSFDKHGPTANPDDYTAGPAFTGGGTPQMARQRLLAGEQAADNDTARAQAGRSLPYRAAATTNEALGTANPKVMEDAADVGNKRAILGQAIGPATVAATPLALKGAARITNPARQNLAERLIQPLVYEGVGEAGADTRLGIRPERALIDEGIWGTKQGMADRLGQRTGDLKNAANNVLQTAPGATQTLDASIPINAAIDNAIQEAKKNGVVDTTHLENLRQALLNEHGPTSGSPLEMNNLKSSIQGVAKSRGAYKNTVPTEGGAATAAGQAAQGIKQTVNTAVPEAAPLNERMANAMDARSGLLRGVEKDKGADLFAGTPGNAFNALARRTIASAPVRSGAARILTLGSKQDIPSPLPVTPNAAPPQVATPQPNVPPSQPPPTPPVQPPVAPPAGPVAPPTQPPVPSNLTGAPAPSATPAAPNVSAPSSNSAPPVLPPVPSSPINPQEVADYSKMLGRPVTAAEIPEIRARLDAERNISTGLSGNRTDQVGNIRETHRATLTQPKRK